MGAGRGDLQAALDVLLALHIGEIIAPVKRLLHVSVSGLRQDRDLAGEVIDQVSQGVNREDLNAAYHRRLRRIDRRHERTAETLGGAGRDHGDDPGDMPHHAIERQLPDDQRVVQQWRGRRLLTRDEDPERDGQVVGGTGLLQVCRGKVHGDPTQGKLATRVANGSAHAVLALPHGGIRQANDHHARNALADIHLDLDQHAVQPHDGAREYLRQHAAPCLCIQKLGQGLSHRTDRVRPICSHGGL